MSDKNEKMPLPEANLDEGDTAGTRSKRFDRRSFLRTAGLVAATSAMAPEAFARNFGPGAEPVRYPEPDVVPLDP
jgi:gluconolactonase